MHLQKLNTFLQNDIFPKEQNVMYRELSYHDNSPVSEIQRRSNGPKKLVSGIQGDQIAN